MKTEYEVSPDWNNVPLSADWQFLQAEILIFIHKMNHFSAVYESCYVITNNSKDVLMATYRDSRKIVEKNIVRVGDKFAFHTKSNA